MDPYPYLYPLLRRLDPEFAHGLALAALRLPMLPVGRPPDRSRLHLDLWGRHFASPLGLAAGFDKHAQAVPGAARLGFAFVEVGGVTPRPQPGNSRPRLFRLEADRAVINRFGFNSHGVALVAERLRRLRETGYDGIIGVNLGKNKDSADAAADYAEGARHLAPHADFLVINVSSPNTPGLRALQDPEVLVSLIAATRAAMQVPRPLLVKLAPDLEDADLQALAQIATDQALDGLIATNTTIARPPTLRDPAKTEAGGLSGAPLMDPSTRVLARLYQLTEGAIPMVGVGGVASGADAYRKIRAGASLVQLYSALVYEGPALVGRILKDLDDLLRADGFDHVSQAVGLGVQDVLSSAPSPAP